MQHSLPTCTMRVVRGVGHTVQYAPGVGHLVCYAPHSLISVNLDVVHMRFCSILFKISPRLRRASFDPDLVLVSSGPFPLSSACSFLFHSHLCVFAIDRFDPGLVLMSPGPGCPDDFNAPSVIGELATRGIPVFGVCLGLQSMVLYFGGKLDILPTPVHGKPYDVKLVNGGG